MKQRMRRTHRQTALLWMMATCLRARAPPLTMMALVLSWKVQSSIINSNPTMALHKTVLMRDYFKL